MEEALEIYIHVPFCVRKCAYCDFYSHPADRASRDAYFDMLSEEISLSPYTGRGVSSVFFGGGTPSAVEEEQIRRILDELTGNFLPQRLVETAGEKALKNHYRQLRKYRKRLPLKNEKDWKYNN